MRLSVRRIAFIATCVAILVGGIALRAVYLSLSQVFSAMSVSPDSTAAPTLFFPGTPNVTGDKITPNQARTGVLLNAIKNSQGAVNATLKSPTRDTSPKALQEFVTKRNDEQIIYNWDQFHLVSPV